ncbi:MAG TPA: HD domain-containing protein [Dehalococcoidales bacterium]
MKNNLIHQVEEYVKDTFSKAEQNNDLLIAHDYKHVDRVRHWALRIAKKEYYQDLEIVEIAALLHDIGLHYLRKNDNRGKHAEVGAEIAVKYLAEKSNLSKKQIDNIATAIKYHCLSPAKVEEHLQAFGDKGKLLEIIRDGDNLDALGAVGLMRAFIAQYYLPEYNPLNIKGDAWALSSVEFRKKFGISSNEGKAPVNYITDQINQQIRYYANLHTMTARNLAFPLVEYMKAFVIQLDSEIINNRKKS